MTKKLYKAFLEILKLRKEFLKSKALSDWKTYTSERNICKVLLKNEKNIFQ